MSEDVTRRSALKSVAAGTVLAGAATATLVGAETAQAQQQKREVGVISPAEAIQDATWRLSFSWLGDGQGSTGITFKSDGTFFTGDGNRGRWFQIGLQVIFAFENVSPPWSVVYASNVNPNGSSFSGIQGKTDTSGNPKGTHSGFRALELVENQAELKSEGTATSSGGKSK